MPGFSRTRTLFQSLDTARYQPHVPGERDPAIERDLALARAEVLGAMLFGHQSVIPAGAVADCPAFKRLLAEVLVNAEPARAEIGRINGERYSPFVVGLEPRFGPVDDDGRSGYDRYVAEYLGAYAPGRGELAAIRALRGKGDERTQRENLVLVGNAFLTGEFDEVYRVNDGFGRHCEHVLAEFSYRSGPTVGVRYAGGDVITRSPPTVYRDLIRQCVAEAGPDGRRLDYAGLDDLERRGEKVFSAIVDGDDPKSSNLRGAWYANRAHFEHHWEVVRVWLDHQLNSLFMQAFDVALPSYFTQSLRPDDEIGRVALVQLDPNQADGLMRVDRPADVPVRPDHVEWRTVWDVLADSNVQSSICRLQERFTALRDADKREGAYQARMRATVDERERDGLVARHGNRVQKAREAVDEHLTVLNATGKGFEVRRSRGGVRVALKNRPAPKERLAARFAVGAGLAADVAGALLIPDPTALIPIIGTGMATVVGAAANGLLMLPPEKGLGRAATWATRRLAGSHRFDNDVAAGFGRSEVDRVSYWTVPRHPVE